MAHSSARNGQGSEGRVGGTQVKDITPGIGGRHDRELSTRRCRRSQDERYRVLEVRIQDVRRAGADLAEHTRALRGFEIESFVRSIARRSRVTTRQRK